MRWRRAADPVTEAFTSEPATETFTAEPAAEPAAETVTAETGTAEPGAGASGNGGVPGPRQRHGAQVPRFDHGSRVPGWDESVDLDKDPAPVPDPATTPVPDELRDEIEAHMAKYPDPRSAAIPALAAVQRWHGWCSPEAVEQAAAVMGLTPGYLVSVATFYDMLETRPVGRHSVYVCTNISCSLCGADDLYAAMQRETGEDPDINLRSFECLGACDLAPMASVDGVYVGPIALDEVPTLVAQIRAGEPPLPDRQLAGRPSADPAVAGPPRHAETPDATPAPRGAVPEGPTSYGGLGQPPRGTPLEDTEGPPAPLEYPPKLPEDEEEDG
ncbi:MAG: NAD(P)H-dependent oxidoreductase subunit E [Actinomycetota bacterium]|nr:NAD(P)H-dependent oxidoreductase subunit E [Actinomycetota bacterium]